jgi:hypothetical protein
MVPLTKSTRTVLRTPPPNKRGCSLPTFRNNLEQIQVMPELGTRFYRITIEESVFYCLKANHF